jgi:hypothetical protein
MRNWAGVTGSNSSRDLQMQPQVPLAAALRGMLLHPASLLRGWNWKAAMFSAMIRATIFFSTNRRTGLAHALRATAVEIAFAICAAGIAGAAVQRLRHAVPRGLTALVVWTGIPAVMATLQVTVHRLSGTPHMKTGVIASFVFAAFASGFNWFAMSRGVFVTGERRSFLRDLAAIPVTIAAFVTAPVRMVTSTSRRR